MRFPGILITGLASLASQPPSQTREDAEALLRLAALQDRGPGNTFVLRPPERPGLFVEREAAEAFGGMSCNYVVTDQVTVERFCPSARPFQRIEVKTAEERIQASAAKRERQRAARERNR